jgi:hypothetical protein
VVALARRPITRSAGNAWPSGMLHRCVRQGPAESSGGLQEAERRGSVKNAQVWGLTASWMHIHILQASLSTTGFF